MEEKKDIKKEEEIQQLALIIKHSPNLVNIASSDGTMTFLNEAGQKMLGLSESEVIGYSIINAFPKNLQSKLTNEMLPALQKDGFWEGDLQYKNAKTKKTIDVHAKCFSIKDEKTGKVKFYVNESIDITEQKMKESEVEAERERFKIIFNSSNDAIMTLAPPNWKFTSGNNYAIKIFGAKDEKEFISFGPWDISPEKQANGNLSSDEAKKNIMIAMKEGRADFEWIHKKYKGDNFPAKVSLVRVSIDGKDLLLATVRDISEEKEILSKITEKTKQLQKINDLMVGRELKMIELKKELAQLKKKLNKN